MGWWRYNEWATPRDLDRRAPLVADVQASYCELSPGGRYLEIEGPEIRPGSAFVDTHTGGIVTVSLPLNIQWLRDSGRYERELFRDENKPEVWLREGVFFVYFRYTAGNDRGRTYDVPQQGWVIDVERRTVVSTDDLDPAAREETLALAAARNREWFARYDDHSSARSPDGRYRLWASEIRPSDYSPAQTGPTATPLNEFRNPGFWFDKSRARPCVSGWRPDSSGVYIIETKPYVSGPIRLFLADPPDKPWWLR